MERTFYSHNYLCVFGDEVLLCKRWLINLSCIMNIRENLAYFHYMIRKLSLRAINLR